MEESAGFLFSYSVLPTFQWFDTVKVSFLDFQNLLLVWLLYGTAIFHGKLRILDGFYMATPLCCPVLCLPWYHERDANTGHLLVLKIPHMLLFVSYRPELVMWPFLIKRDPREVSSFMYPNREEKKVWINNTGVGYLPT